LRARLEYELRAGREGIQAALNYGRELPAWAKDPPIKAPGDEFYLAAFRQLSTCRHVGEQIGPIPWVAIVEYARHCRLDDDVADVFVQAIMAMDAGYMEDQHRQMEQARREADRKARRSRRA
jgi:hypothetical protein